MLDNIACGSYHTLAITAEGAVYFAGSTQSDKSGILIPYGCTQINQFTKVKLPTPHKIIQASAGGEQNFLVCEKRELWAIGNNANGQLGLGTDVSIVRSYTRVTTLPKPVQYVVANGGHTLALLIDGSLWATGYNANGQLGLATTEDKKIFTQVRNLPPHKTIIFMAVGKCASFLVFDDGSLWAAGSNENAYLGLPEPIDYCVFTQVSNNLIGKRVVEVVPGLNSTLLRLEDGQLMGVGENLGGQLGLGHKMPVTNFTLIHTLPKDKKVRLMAAGNFFNIVVLEDNTVWGAGNNLFGQLGLDESLITRTVTLFTQAKFSPETGIIRNIAAGADFALLLLNNGQLWGTGNNNSGALGLPKKIEYLKKYTLIPFPKSDLGTASAFTNLAARVSSVCRQQLNPYQFGVFSLIASKTTEAIATTMFMPELYGCPFCKSYVKPSVWGDCPLHLSQKKPASKATAMVSVSAVFSIAQLLQDVDELMREENYEEALILLRRAAQQDDARACYLLGKCYKEGLGVYNNERQAYVWYLQAATQGYAEAQYDLAICYQEGKGIVKDKEKAILWFQKAVEQGNKKAKEALAHLGASKM